LAICQTNLSNGQPLPKIHLTRVYPKLVLDRALWMSEIPDDSGRMFITEQNGRILITQKGGDGGASNEFLNITLRKPHADNNNVGLLGMAAHPGFKTNGLIYVYYSQLNTNHAALYPRRAVISEFKASADDPLRADPNSERVLLDVPEPSGGDQGGEICFGPDGFLYIGLGDGESGNDPACNGQNTSSLLSKILRIDVNGRSQAGHGKPPRLLPYAIPADNPFAGEPDLNGAGARREIFALGLREPWRFSFDRETGDLWTGDVGQDLWEEVDLVVKGGNYGWPVREGAHHFKPGPVGAQFVEPILEYPHKTNLLAQSISPDHGTGVCIVGGYVYRGRKFPALRGVYVYADYVTGTIWGLRYRDGKVLESGTLLAQPKNIESFAEDNDGEIYAMSFDPQEENSAKIFALEAE
jgi:quinoprotein glucose dehydrogenase